MIAITGTNGKTTSCYLISQMLNNLGIKCGYIGTIGFYINEKIKDLNNTTPDILDIYEMLLECKKNGCEYVALEASSHALSKDRLKGLLFDYAVFTNLTEEHLDYHKTMDNYANAKSRIIYQLEDILLFTERNALTNKSPQIRYFAWHFAVNNLIPDNFIPTF